MSEANSAALGAHANKHCCSSNNKEPLTFKLKSLLLPAMLLMILGANNANAANFAMQQNSNNNNSSGAAVDGSSKVNKNNSATSQMSYTASNSLHDDTTHCIVSQQDNSKVLKQIGSTWLSLENPCQLHACQINEQGRAQEIINTMNCEQFQCDADSELRPMQGSCCGICVRSKCSFNNQIYQIGQVWHNASNNCQLLECVQLPNGEPSIRSYEKSCAPLKPGCAAEDVHMVDCCAVCQEGFVQPRADLDVEQQDIWQEEFYRQHECNRECQPNAAPMNCYYKFNVEWFETMSKACYNCPQNMSDCSRPHCILGDGIARSITVVNRMMPGPAIEVCENDNIVVDVINDLLGESTTIHWHGLHQRKTPYMDGVPHITQCPITPHSTFRYSFRADSAGTQFWHSHTGMQRGDGVFGALIIRRPKVGDPHGHLFDYDLSEHKMLLQDWVHVPGVSMFASHHHSSGDNKPMNLLVNGRGRYYKAIWQAAKQAAQQAAKPANGRVAAETDATDKPLHIYEEIPLVNVEILATESNEIARLARLARANSNSSAAQSQSQPQNRSRRATLEQPEQLQNMPLSVFKVTQGFRYRFRIINAEFLNCPIQVSVDNHSLLAISSDGYDFEAVEVGSIITYAGERFDFVLNANQPIGNYWIRFKGLMDCSEKFTSAFQVAILRYESAPETEPSGMLGYSYPMEGIELNAMNRGSGHLDSLTIAELKALPSYDHVSGIDEDALVPEADYKFFVYYDFYRKDHPSFHPAEYYGINANLSSSNILFTPQLNHISLEFPSEAMLPSRFELDESKFCNDSSLQQQGVDCREQFCKCQHVLQVPLGAIVEFIIVDEGFTFDANHPFHLHGNAFRVVGLERLGSNVTIEVVKQLDQFNLLKRNLERPPVKDTVTVPDGGYTILRLEASNPGYWLFHCHIEFHAEIGMALVLKVGDNQQMEPVPQDFPSCKNYMPSDQAQVETTTASDSMTTQPENGCSQSNGSFMLWLLSLGAILAWH